MHAGDTCKVDSRVKLDSMERAIWDWYGRLPLRLQVRLKRGYKAFALQWGKRTLTCGSMFTGSDIVHKVLCKVLHVMGRQVDEPLDIARVVFQCEKDTGKQEFLKVEFPDAPRLYSDVAHLNQIKCRNETTGCFETVPSCDVFTAGFACKTRSRLNSARSSNRDCVQKQTTDTGETYVHARAYSQRRRPTLFVLENVVDLAEGGDNSDRAYIERDLRVAGTTSRSSRSKRRPMVLQRRGGATSMSAASARTLWCSSKWRALS